MTTPATVAIMQPYLFPYIGYFQLVAAVDQFVIYDTVKYTKKGWINRNRFLRDGAPVTFTLPLEKGSDQRDIRERHVAAGFEPDGLCAQIAQAYRHAPYRRETMPLVEDVLGYRSADLFDHLRHGLLRTCAHLSIATPIHTASAIEGVTDLRRQDRVLALCERLGAATYVNPIGGTTLYDPAAFTQRGIALRFLRARSFDYVQGPHPFVPWLSILDVLMFNPRSALTTLLAGGYDLVDGDGHSSLDPTDPPANPNMRLRQHDRPHPA